MMELKLIDKSTENPIFIEEGKKRTDLTKITYTVSQLITKSRMLKTPLLIVEGKDDVPFYQAVGKLANKNLDVRAVETIPGYGEGCSNVRKAIEDNQDKIKESIYNSQYILGIIDKDASYYRGENYEHLLGLFRLNSYSYECHFTTKSHIEFLINKLLTSNNDVNNKVIEYIFYGYTDTLKNLYFLSLEALKNACVKDYNSVLGYSLTYGNIKNNFSRFYNEVNQKRKDIEKFEKEIGVSFDDYKSVIKGKWLLGHFVDFLFERIDNIHKYCNNHEHPEIKTCQFCANNEYTKCLWKIKKHYTCNMAHNFILEHIEPQEIEYITTRIKQLA